MKRFEEYQNVAAKVPVSLRNDRDQINFPVSGLQGATGKIGSLLDRAFAEDKFSLTPEQRLELQNRLSDIHWCSAVLCNEAEISFQYVAAHSIAQLQARAKDFNPDRR